MQLKQRASLKSLEKSLLLAFLTLSLISCNSKDLGALPLEEISPQEVFIAKTFHKSYGTCQGSRRLYFCYGRSPLGEPAGVALESTRYVRVRLKQLLERFPEIQDPRVARAIAKQEKELY